MHWKILTWGCYRINWWQRGGEEREEEQICVKRGREKIIEKICRSSPHAEHIVQVLADSTSHLCHYMGSCCYQHSPAKVPSPTYSSSFEALLHLPRKYAFLSLTHTTHSYHSEKGNKIVQRPNIKIENVYIGKGSSYISSDESIW